MVCWSTIGGLSVCKISIHSKDYLDATNAELYQGTQHLAACNLVSGTTDSTFDQQTVIVGLVWERHCQYAAEVDVVPADRNLRACET